MDSKAKTNTNLLLFLGLGGVVVAGAAFFASPWLALMSLRDAATKGDRDALMQKVDFPALREDLKSQVQAQIAQQMAEDRNLTANPFGGVANMMMPAIVNAAIDTYVTPDSVALVVQTGKMSGNKTNGQAKDEASKVDLPKIAWGSLDRAQAIFTTKGSEQAVTLNLARTGLLSWRLVGVGLPTPEPTPELTPELTPEPPLRGGAPNAQ